MSSSWVVPAIAGLALFGAGLGLGGFATRTLYGDPDREAVRPRPERPVLCPPCEACPVCPPPPECEGGELVTADRPLPESSPLDAAGPVDDDGRPGLSLGAVARGEAAVRAATAPCPLGGAAVLQVTLTVTGTTGHVEDAVVTRQPPDDPDGSACLERAARQARFAGDGLEGASILKIALSPPSLSD